MNFQKSGKVDQKAGRAINRRLILNLVRTQGKISRSELSTLTGLSAAAVGFVVGDLVEEGYLFEGVPEGTGAGRKRVPLTLNVHANRAVGLRLSSGRLDCMLSDFSMEVIASETVDLPSMDPAAVVSAAKDTVSHLLARNNTDARILGAGLAAPGMFDSRTGICETNYRFGWKDVPIGPMLSEALDMPVVVENDTYAFGLAHQLYGLGQSSHTFLALAVGAGIGCAIIDQDLILHGTPGNAGEVGHVLDDENGPLCECGRKGCLQARYSVPALEAQWRDLGHTNSLDEAMATEDNAALTLVRDAGRRIGRHLAEWVTLLYPEMIILGGEGVRFGAPFITAMQDEMSTRYYRAQAPRIVADESEFYWTAGAAAIAIQKVFRG